MPKEKSAGVVVFRREKNQTYYLLLRYQSGHWDFPKGHLEKGETEWRTAKRETAEETGIKDLKIIHGFKYYIKYFFRKSYGLEGEARKKAPWVFKLVVFYLAQTQSKEVKISEEHIGFIWLPYDQAMKRLTFKNAKNILQEANEYVVSRKSLRGR